MKINKSVLFISDLHLDESTPKSKYEFLTLLANCDKSSIDAIYILGDLFEVWIGDDDNSPFIQAIMHALKHTTTKGIPIYFIHGNRDFLIGKKFSRATGCTILAEETRIHLYGESVLLMHGDTLCTRDIVYLKARKKGRNPFIQKIFLLLPLRIRKKIADKMRAKSKQHTQSAKPEIMDVTQSEVEQVMRKHDVRFLIHGHTHRLATHQFQMQDISHTRIVLDAWHECGNVLVWNESGKREFCDVNLNPRCAYHLSC